MFVGYLPFNTGNHASTSEAGRSELVRQAVAGVLPDTVGGIPEPWQTLIRRCLNADPERRVRNAAQCRDILAENSNNNQSGTASDRSSHFSDFTDENDETIRDIGITPKANPEPKPEPPKPQPEKKRKRSKLSLMLGLGIPLGIVLTYILSFVILSVFENYVFSWQSNNTPTEVTVIEPAFVLVEGGTFWMGSTDNGAYADEAPIHSVTLSSFYIGKYEVTQAEWKAIMGSNPSHFKGDNLPVESVSWNDVQEFITRLSSATGKHYRLPTEAEWEFAARGGNQSRDYTYAGSNNIDGVAWYSGNSSNKTHAVGTKSSNELGIYDMSGNVWEWCSDWYGSYSAAQQTNPTGPAGTNRVLRGGSLADDAQICRSAYRFSYSPSYGLSFLGFRLVFVP
jgi:formylglycine-generating enzyme required for sulfatase activity